MNRVLILFCLSISSCHPVYANESYNDNLTAKIYTQTTCDQIIDLTFYKICYSYKHKGAKYVSYHLTYPDVDTKNIRKRFGFRLENTIPKEFRSSRQDYSRNIYGQDRGHLAPDASFDYTLSSLHSVYTIANIIPQYKYINRHTWIKAEKEERIQAKNHGSVYVINGVIYEEDPIKDKKMGIHGISVPTYFWKMIYTGDHKLEECFLYKNKFNYYRNHADILASHGVPCSSLIK